MNDTKPLLSQAPGQGMPANVLRALWHRYTLHRYRLVFYSLLLTLVVAPLLSQAGLDAKWLAPLLALNVFSAVLGAVQKRRHQLELLLPAGLLLVISALPGSITGNLVNVFAVGCSVVVAVVAIIVSVRYALLSGAVGSEQVYASLSGYLLAGVVFAVLYSALDHALPGSLGPAGGTSSVAPMQLDQSIYFSFVTLATLGYGDIVPLSSLARGLAVLEAVAGQLYIAVLVASLISSYTQTRGGGQAS